MGSHRVTYNISGKIFETWCDDGTLETFFVFPPRLKGGDKLPSLRMHVPGEIRAFCLLGQYNAEREDIEFVLDGPLGYVYRLNVSVDPRSEASQTWTARKQGLTTSPVDYSRAMVYVPRQICVREASLNGPSTKDILMKPCSSFNSSASPESVCSLRLCITVTPIKLNRRQEELRSSQDQGFFHRRQRNLLRLRATSCGDSSRFTEIDEEEEGVLEGETAVKQKRQGLDKAKALVSHLLRPVDEMVQRADVKKIVSQKVSKLQDTTKRILVGKSRAKTQNK